MIIARKDFLAAIELHFDRNGISLRPRVTELSCRRYTLFVQSIMRHGNRLGLMITWEPKQPKKSLRAA